MNNIQNSGVGASDSKKIINTIPTFTSNQQAAIYWFHFGFSIIPDSKQSLIEPNSWLEDLSHEKIQSHWSENPDHDVGFVVGDDIIVFDVCSLESIKALAEIEEAFGLIPNLFVKTNKGEHHYYRRAEGTLAKSYSHTTKFPSFIDIKTGCAISILPPNTVKEAEILEVIREVYSTNDLTEIGQDAIDAVCRHNVEAEEPHKTCNVDNLPSENKIDRNFLDKYSLKGRLEEMEKLAVDVVYILDKIALLGQLTAVYAAPNSGKTLLILRLLIEGIKDGRIDPSNLYYINVDDDHKGLTEKLGLAEEYGFHMLSDGYQNFKTDEFLVNMQDMIEKDQAHGVIIILDTLKKFTDLMDKRKVSSFTKVVRQFALKGGTLIALAHTNKNLSSAGKPVYGGTNDIMSDFDCAYTLDTISDKDDKKIVVFENTKRRGSVAQRIAYSYSTEDGIAYTDLLLSVAPVDESQVVSLKQAEQLKPDAEIIHAVKICIRNGINTKMKLIDAVSERAGVSNGNAKKIIDKYTGETQELHFWKFTVGNRGAKMFVLLEA